MASFINRTQEAQARDLKSNKQIYSLCRLLLYRCLWVLFYFYSSYHKPI